ncbi:hypothetical protein M758_9G079500 [Ceratodon purpureus]|nr:hypothetical protein M758_9G079500 [Ceratodon purpureus]
MTNCGALEESAARALGDLGAYVNVSEHNSVPCFYTCEISTSLTGFTVSMVRRRNLAIESGCHNLDKSPIFHIGAVNFLKAIRVLVACPTLTDAQFSFSYMAYCEEYIVPPMSENLLSEVFTLLKSSPSLSCFHVTNLTANASLHCKHLQTLVCRNPRLETLRVSADGPNFLVLAKAIAVCLSRNTVLKSFTLHMSPYGYELNQISLEMLLSPFTSSSPSEANANLKELALYFQYADGYCVDAIACSVDAIANLMCRNTTLKKLDLRFSKLRSSLKDRKSSWREICRALEVNRSLEELSCPCEVAALRELLVPFVPNRYGRQPNTTLSTLRLFLSIKDHGGWIQAIVNDPGVVLRDLASALQSNTSLKHVQCIYECDGNGAYMDDVKYINDKKLCQAELQIQEILRLMIDNELRVNTSLETLTVGHWTLRRVGTKWQTCYRGPCLREAQTKEYIVKVQSISLFQ